MSTNDPFLLHVREYMEAHEMAPPGERLLVALSGGADSMALMVCLRRLGFGVEAIHLNHGLRGAAAKEDEEFVRRQCAEAGVTCHVLRQPLAQEAREQNRNFEALSRERRLALFAAHAKERGCHAVAVGHHMDDQAETVLMRLLRGAGPPGLAAIHPVATWHGQRFIRPLLSQQRQTIVQWLERLAIPWREDETNADPAYLRNRIRRELLPLLQRDYNPNAAQALARFAEAQALENGLLESLTEEAWNQCCPNGEAVDRQAFRRLHPALRRRLVQRYAASRQAPLNSGQVRGMAEFVAHAPVGQHYAPAPSLLLYAGRTHAEPVRQDQTAAADATVPLALPGITEAWERRFRVRRMERPPGVPLDQYCGPGRQVFDAEALGAPLAVRARRPGDAFVPLGMTGKKKLKDYMMEAGIPAPRRKSHPLVVGENGIAWVVGHAVAAHAAVTPKTRACIEIEVEPCD